MTTEMNNTPAITRRNPHALIVDDNNCNRQVLSLAVTSFGATFGQAADGFEALERMAGEAFDIIFMDIAMPRMDGLAATSAIRAAGHDVMVVAVTAHYDACDAAKLMALGFDGLIPKPIDMAQVLAWLQLLKPDGGMSS